MTTREQALRALKRKLRAMEKGRVLLVHDLGLRTNSAAWTMAVRALGSARYYSTRSGRPALAALRRAVASLSEAPR